MIDLGSIEFRVFWCLFITSRRSESIGTWCLLSIFLEWIIELIIDIHCLIYPLVLNSDCSIIIHFYQLVFHLECLTTIHLITSNHIIIHIILSNQILSDSQWTHINHKIEITIVIINMTWTYHITINNIAFIILHFITLSIHFQLDIWIWSLLGRIIQYNHIGLTLPKYSTIIICSIPITMSQSSLLWLWLLFTIQCQSVLVNLFLNVLNELVHKISSTLSKNLIIIWIDMLFLSSTDSIMMLDYSLFMF